jgi:hypothetical protein
MASGWDLGSFHLYNFLLLHSQQEICKGRGDRGFIASY